MRDWQFDKKVILENEMPPTMPADKYSILKQIFSDFSFLRQNSLIFLWFIGKNSLIFLHIVLPIDF